MDLIQLDAKAREPLYIQLYRHYRQEIESGRIGEGFKLPSIRRLAKGLSVSKITVEKAYQQLTSEGYIENSERSRYTVGKFEDLGFQGELEGLMVTNEADAGKRLQAQASAGLVRFDFASGGMDIHGFDFLRWKRYISKAFAEKERLLGYGNIKGEESLRREIAAYIRRSRGVCAAPEQIIVGAGVQSLLTTLCPLLKTGQNKIAFEEPGFKNGRRVFADHGFSIIPINMSKGGIDIEALLQADTQLVYVSPSHQFPTGYIMPAGKRSRLLRWAEQVKGLIIEDDYDSELRYFGRPIPALKAMDSKDSVVYVSSFSKVLPPSIRLSYMVLPERLLAIYEQDASFYNQTASLLEQLALAQFMEEGHFERQIRRLRKLYQEKSRYFFSVLKKKLGVQAEIKDTESGLHTILRLKSVRTAGELAERALAKGCKVAPVENYYLQATGQENRQLPQIILYFSQIPAADLEEAVQLLAEAWCE